MRKVILIIVLGLFVFSSCDPDVPGEGINLPEMRFGLKVNSDTAYIKLGDTITLYSSISSTLDNGIRIEDGKAAIDLYIGYTSQIPITEFGFQTIEENIHTSIILNKGDIKIHPSTKKIVEIYALPYGDSIQVDISFVPLKTGTYSFQTQSLFFEGSQGKTRTNPTFDMPNHHFDELWKIPGDDYKPGDYGYDNRYLFAVYE